MSAEKIKAGIAKLDVNNDVHWDKDGKPAVNIVKAYAGVKTLTAAQVEEAYPGYTRETARGTAAPAAPIGNDATDGNAGEPGATNVVTPPAVAPGDPIPPVPPAPQDGTKMTAPPVVDPKPKEISPSTEKTAGNAVPENPDRPVSSMDEGKSEERLELEDRLRRIDEQLTEIQLKRKDTQELLDALIEKETPQQESFGENNQRYLEAQNKLREEKGRRLQALREQGFNRKEFEKMLPGPAPIDRALSSRKRQVG